MCRTGLSTGFPRVTSTQVIVFALFEVRSDNELAPLGVARFLAFEAQISGQLVLSIACGLVCVQIQHQKYIRAIVISKPAKDHQQSPIWYFLFLLVSTVPISLQVCE